MVQDEIDQSEAAYDSADQNRFQRGRAPDGVSVESRDERDHADPGRAVSPAELLAKGLRAGGFERRGIRQSIAQINQPRGQEERQAVPNLKGNAERPGKEPKPCDRNERRIQANQIQPEDGTVAWTRPYGDPTFHER